MEEEIKPVQTEAPIVQTIESLAYRLIVMDRLPLSVVKHKLEANGFQATKKDLLKMKRKLLKLADRELRAEYEFENILDSYERVKTEFEDSVNRQKRYIEQFEDEGKLTLAMEANKTLVDQSVIALKNLGRLTEKANQIRANNINIVNAPDISNAFKIILRRWFLDMKAKIENGQLIFENPTPEILDDFFKWQNERNRKEFEQVMIDAEPGNTGNNTTTE